ncbi:hypothetical protein N0V90_001747 [Kalmusia sp. IMI 367209]|nr:hypothetical protein N0V90_001747 [Kalmusia sp. IMI 367209]
MAGELVGYFEIRLADAGPEGTQDLIDIHGNEQFYLGRSSALCERHWSDPTISNRHLRIHCILYEKIGTGEVPPLVYATDVSSNGTFLKKNNAACASSQTDHGFLMTNKHGAFLLDDKDELRISESVTLIYHDLDPVEEAGMTSTQQSEKHHFASRYLITGRLLGKGGFGMVVVGIHQKTQRQLACKIINLKESYQGSFASSLQLRTKEQAQCSIADRSLKRWPSKVVRCSREFRILKNLSHPNIVSVEKVFWSLNTIYMFQELITGGDLFSFMERKGDRLAHIDAAIIILQILKAVDYLHDQNIVHRDLKPDNILLTYPEDGARIVISDFGNARALPKEQGATSCKSRRMFSAAGTLEYVAPEIYGKNETIPSDLGYSQAVDMWSIGVITANLLSGEAMFSNRFDPRFEQDPRTVILELSSKCDISIIDDPNHLAWSKVGHRPKDFIRSLLALRETDRMTAKQALAHSWFTNEYHAAEFEALYNRSIIDWQPRCKVVKLVESISAQSTSVENIESTACAKSHHFQPRSVQALVHDFEEQFSGSQDWDLSVVYPPSGDESFAAEQEKARYDEPSYNDQCSCESGTVSSYAHPHGSAIPSMNELSLAHDPVDSLVIFQAPVRTFRDHPVSGSTLVDGLAGPNNEQYSSASSSDTSIVYETPITDEQQHPHFQVQDITPYSDAFTSEEPGEANLERCDAYKKRKLAHRGL